MVFRPLRIVLVVVKASSYEKRRRREGRGGDLIQRPSVLSTTSVRPMRSRDLDDSSMRQQTTKTMSTMPPFTLPVGVAMVHQSEEEDRLLTRSRSLSPLFIDCGIEKISPALCPLTVITIDCKMIMREKGSHGADALERLYHPSCVLYSFSSPLGTHRQ